MHREEKTFSITLHLSAEFGDDYAGDEDSFAWHERFQGAVKPALVAAVLVLVIAGGVLSLEGALRPGEGMFLVLAGCVVALIGGVLAKPSGR